MSNPQWPEQTSDPYGQPQHGQPVYGQPVYGQQPDFGPPQYANPAYAPLPSFSARLSKSSMPVPPAQPAPPALRASLRRRFAPVWRSVLVLAPVVVRSARPPSQE